MYLHDDMVVVIYDEPHHSQEIVCPFDKHPSILRVDSPSGGSADRFLVYLIHEGRQCNQMDKYFYRLNRINQE